VPLGYGKLFSRTDPTGRMSRSPSRRERPARLPPRGKVLGGSSSINGLVLSAASARLRRLAIPGWGFDDLLPYFRKSEDQSRGADPGMAPADRSRCRTCRDHELCDAFIASAMALGIPGTTTLTAPRQEGTGYTRRQHPTAGAAAPRSATCGRPRSDRT